MSRAAVQELAQRFIKALIAGDMPELLDCYDDDIVFEAPGLPMIIGKAGVEKHYRMVFGLKVTACRQVPERIEERADCVIEAGSYVCIAANILGADKKWTRDQAAIGGNVVRLYKLFSAVLDQTVQNRRETSFILSRLAFRNDRHDQIPPAGVLSEADR